MRASHPSLRGGGNLPSATKQSRRQRETFVRNPVWIASSASLLAMTVAAARLPLRPP
ncbi:MAG: hypothetical protein LBT00_00450 [Spirochaetaceae bacterium]|nr:hypothetical protein [Spirochaetaceae bacterium]